MHEYKELAAKLGDVVYKLLILEQQKAELIEQIKRLDIIAGQRKAEAPREKEKQTP